MLAGFQSHKLHWVCAFALLLTAPLSRADAWTSEKLVVNTTLGPVRGVLRNGRRVFRGIPYAAPPTGDLRFRPPAEHAGWQQALDASDFGPSCLQTPGGCWESSNVTRQSEDCLTVNVLTPGAPPPRAGYAVMVFIHAGEFRCGCSNDAESNWPSYGDQIVYVSFNFRIGALGFLADSSLRARDPLGGTGNYGLLDQRFALQWVQENIAAFGGNPSDVTITGESSGGTSVAFHLLAAGRGQGQPFQKVILQSPGLGQVRDWEDAMSNTDFTLAALAAAGSPHCMHTYGYVTFVDDVLQARHPLHVENFTSQGAAKKWCTAAKNCTGFMYTPNMTVFISGAPLVFDLEAVNLQNFQPISFLKQGPERPEDRIRCLISADAMLIQNLTESVPKDDTFYTDGWAPVVDGVTLPEPLEDQMSKGGVPSSVNALLGSNLDEGTEFMFLSPKLACNATKNDFDKWVTEFLGPDMVQDIGRLYAPSMLARPLPACQQMNYRSHVQPPKLSGEESIYFNAAMRIAGDVSIACPTLDLAKSMKGRAFTYRFGMTPTFSWNFADTSTMGAFHGADVPFVNGILAELNTTAERELSQAMSCFWGSFARNGEPSEESCADGTAWPAFQAGGAVMRLGPSLGAEPWNPLAAERCAVLQKASHKPGRRSQRREAFNSILL